MKCAGEIDNPNNSYQEHPKPSKTLFLVPKNQLVTFGLRVVLVGLRIFDFSNLAGGCNEDGRVLESGTRGDTWIAFVRPAKRKTPKKAKSLWLFCGFSCFCSGVFSSVLLFFVVVFFSMLLLLWLFHIFTRPFL